MHKPAHQILTNPIALSDFFYTKIMTKYLRKNPITNKVLQSLNLFIVWPLSRNCISVNSVRLSSVIIILIEEKWQKERGRRRVKGEKSKTCPRPCSQKKWMPSVNDYICLIMQIFIHFSFQHHVCQSLSVSHCYHNCLWLFLLPFSNKILLMNNFNKSFYSKLLFR